MSSSWAKVNPDNAVDVLPQPFRSIVELLDEVLEAVGEQIDAIVKRRQSEEYEHTLPQAVPTTTIAVPGRVTCAAAEPRGLARLALGTSNGEAYLIDTQTQQVAAQRHAFGDEEAVSCVSLCADASYAPRPPAPGQEQLLAPRPYVKLIVAGRVTPRILVFDVRKHAYGTLLEPACAVQLPKPEAEEESRATRPLVEQLHTRGTDDGIWVVALMDRTIRAYLVPLGTPEDRSKDSGAGAGTEGMLDKPIMEDEEEEEEAEEAGQGQGGGDEFADKPQVRTPTYCFELHSLAVLPGLPEPSLDRLSLSVSSVRSESRAIALGTAARQVPLVLMVSSPESNVLLGYSLEALPPPAAPKGSDLETLLKQAPPALGALREPEEARGSRPRRRWELPAEVTATAVSPCGSAFAAGGARGGVALIDLARGMSLSATLPCHHGAVTALAFHRCDVLVSAGADSWVHHYNASTGELLARYLCAPPAIPPSLEGPPGVEGVAVAQTLPLGISLDGSGGMRLHDLQRGCKFARASHTEAPLSPAASPTAAAGLDATSAPAMLGGGAAGSRQALADEIGEAERPRRVLASATAFCVLCQDPGPAEAENNPEAAAEEPPAGEAEEEGQEAERSWLLIFDYASTLKDLYPQLGSKADRGPHVLAEAFKNLAPAGAAADADAEAEAEAAAAAATQPPADATARLQTTQRGSTMQGRAGTGSVAGSVAGSAQPTAKLTAENLRTLAKPSSKTQGTAAAASVMLSSAQQEEGAGSAAGPKRDARKAAAAPDNWQVSVRRFLRGSCADKEARQRRIHRRLEQLRKDLEGV